MNSWISEGVLTTPKSSFQNSNDYPVCLSESQRFAFQRHVAYHVQKYAVVHRTLLIVQKGLESLNKITQRLEEEKAYLTKCLSNPDAVPLLQAPPSGSNSGSDPPRKGIFSSGRFSKLQATLRIAHQEEENNSVLTAKRERIAKECRLNQIQRDLDEYLPQQRKLEAKASRCRGIEERTKTVVLPLMDLYDEMLTAESAYAASFSLYSRDEPHQQPNDTALRIPFKPTVYTSAINETIRLQVEEVLDSYLVYRSHIDPILAKLSEERHIAQEATTNQLLDLIGVTNDSNQFSSAVDSSLHGESTVTNHSSPSTEPENARKQMDTEDRQIVESALNALDDFEDIC